MSIEESDIDTGEKQLVEETSGHRHEHPAGAGWETAWAAHQPPSVVTARPLAIKTVDLSRTYKVKGEKREKGISRAKDRERKTLVALDGVNVEVYQGELFGLLGPNGAGKTTLIKILTTLLLPTSGKAYVAGHDVEREAGQVRRLINMVSGGETSGYGMLTTRENLWMWTQLYGVTWKEAYAHIDELLKIVELEDKRNVRISTLSTGERQRMNFCRGFLTDPTVLFLDEPTLGLDVHAARIVRAFTKDWLRSQPDRTLLLTTHYMAEADELCDRIAIIDKGKVLACDTPANLKHMLQRQPVFELQVASIEHDVLDKVETIPGVVHATSSDAEGGAGYKLKLILEEEPVIGSVVTWLAGQRASIASLQKNEPTLEDVFIKLVGRGLGSGDEEGTSNEEGKG